MVIMRDWINLSFRRSLLNRGLTSLYQVEATVETEVSSFVIFCKLNTKYTYGYSQPIISRERWKMVVGCVLQMWNNIISIHFKDEDCTTQWRQTFTMDFEGKYKQVCYSSFAGPCKLFLVKL